MSDLDPKLSKALTARLRTQIESSLARRRGRRRHDPNDWDGQYGNGSGLAHPCVEFITCPACAQKPGNLCMGSYGIHFSTHYERRRQYAMARRKLERELLEQKRKHAGTKARPR